MPVKLSMKALVAIGVGGCVTAGIFGILAVRRMSVPGVRTAGVPTLRWTISTDPPVRHFKVESTPVDTSPRGFTAPTWTAVGTYDAAICYAVTGPRGRTWLLCSQPVPDKDLRYRVKACNNTPTGCIGGTNVGMNCTVDTQCPGGFCNVDGCSRQWVEEAFLACCDPTRKTGCPCLLYPSAPGCIP